MKKLALVIALLLPAAGTAYLQPAKLQRLPLSKKRLVLKSPAEYEHRIRRDERTGKTVSYDPKPRVRLLDANSGRYAFEWIGYDGKGKRVVYQRADAIDVVVSASAQRTDSGQLVYVYKVKNLPTSGQHLAIFAAQNFSSDARPLKLNEFYVGPMSNNKEMRHGNWIGFGALKPFITPGLEVEFRLVSSSPPGLVECSVAGGEQGMKGAGEDMPQELENALPGYEAWPRGYTIGPNENLKALSVEERVRDILLWLPQFKKLGWMTADVLPSYENSLRATDLEKVFRQTEQDLKANKITSEVHAIIQAIR